MSAKNYLVTGGCGFIGANYVARLIKEGKTVTIADNLSRKGSEKNLTWLKKEFGDKSFRFEKVDIRDATAIEALCKSKDVIAHLAAQVAVTTSVVDPRFDFEVNAVGTLNVLEGARLANNQPIVIYSSTNKVYGGLEHEGIVEDKMRYRYAKLTHGVSEECSLDFHSPYGCSKGAADQYVRDYCRIFGIPTLVFRQSCIYGERQFGIVDQGWVSFLIINSITGRPICIYGDGKQVRDLLHVRDLLDVFEIAISKINQCKGQIYNIGGGMANSISVWSEFGPRLETLCAKKITVKHEDWRPGDQKVFVCDISKAKNELGWVPKINLDSGIKQAFDWVKANQDLFD